MHTFGDLRWEHSDGWSEVGKCRHQELESSGSFFSHTPSREPGMTGKRTPPGSVPECKPMNSTRLELPDCTVASGWLDFVASGAARTLISTNKGALRGLWCPALGDTGITPTAFSCPPPDSRGGSWARLCTAWCWQLCVKHHIGTSCMAPWPPSHSEENHDHLLCHPRPCHPPTPSPPTQATLAAQLCTDSEHRHTPAPGPWLGWPLSLPEVSALTSICQRGQPPRVAKRTSHLSPPLTRPVGVCRTYGPHVSERLPHTPLQPRKAGLDPRPCPQHLEQDLALGGRTASTCWTNERRSGRAAADLEF